MERFSRTEMLIGAERMALLKNARVAVIGLGGVGSYSAEALARAGVGNIDLFDSDIVSESNINRQLIALTDTIGQAKVYAAARRINQINPAACVKCRRIFIDNTTFGQIDFCAYDYIIDAIDTISAKILIAKTAYFNRIPIISCMSTGNKLDPSKFIIDDIFNTKICPIARVMRRELRAAGVKKLNVLYSSETPITPAVKTFCGGNADSPSNRQIPASISFVPSVAGLMLAGQAIRDIAGLNI